MLKRMNEKFIIFFWELSNLCFSWILKSLNGFKTQKRVHILKVIKMNTIRKRYLSKGGNDAGERPAAHAATFQSWKRSIPPPASITDTSLGWRTTYLTKCRNRQRWGTYGGDGWCALGLGPQGQPNYKTFGLSIDGLPSFITRCDHQRTNKCDGHLFKYFLFHCPDIIRLIDLLWTLAVSNNSWNTVLFCDSGFIFVWCGSLDN